MLSKNSELNLKKQRALEQQLTLSAWGIDQPIDNASEESEEEIDTESVVLEQLHELALRHAKKSERQPYIVGQLRHGAEITIMLDSGCAAKGAICEEHLLQWRKEGKLDHGLEARKATLAKPIPDKSNHNGVISTKRR